MFRGSELVNVPEKYDADAAKSMTCESPQVTCSIPLPSVCVLVLKHCLLHLYSAIASLSSSTTCSIDRLLDINLSIDSSHSMSKTFSTADVASHNKSDNLYIIVDEDVYDLTKFQDEHPGMLKPLCDD